MGDPDESRIRKVLEEGELFLLEEHGKLRTLCVVIFSEEKKCEIKNIVTIEKDRGKGYGRYMIQESGHFELDPNLEDYVDFESYGKRRIQEEHGILGDRGYVAYLGMDSEVKEIMARNIPSEQHSQGLQPGGMRME